MVADCKKQGDQVKTIEQTRVTNKKRSGVAQFIKYFPIYVARIETQLVGADGYETRSMVDAAYEKLVQSMLECLKTMAKIDGDGEDKGQLNYHVILIGKCYLCPGPSWQELMWVAENMFYFIHELSEQQLGAVRTFIRKAEDIYEENLLAYVKLVLRRPMGKLLVSGVIDNDSAARLNPRRTTSMALRGCCRPLARKVLPPVPTTTRAPPSESSKTTRQRTCANTSRRFSNGFRNILPRTMTRWCSSRAR